MDGPRHDLSIGSCTMIFSKPFAFAIHSLALWLLASLATSTEVTAQDGDIPHVVMLIAEREYQTDETLPRFAKKHLAAYRMSFVFADSDDHNRLSGLDAIKTADVLLVSVRRRTLPKAQLDLIRDYVAQGKPVIGIRTASHAFCLRNQDPPVGRDAWPEFDRVVFGGHYTNHYGNDLAVSIRPVSIGTETAEGDAATELMAGIDFSEPRNAGGSLYRVSPLVQGAKVVLVGRVEGHPEEPVAWTFQRKDGGISVYTSLGHVDDFQGPVLPQFLSNAIQWCLSAKDALSP